MSTISDCAWKITYKHPTLGKSKLYVVAARWHIDNDGNLFFYYSEGKQACRIPATFWLNFTIATDDPTEEQLQRRRDLSYE